MSNALSEIRDALAENPVRIEFSIAFGSTGSVPSAQVYRKDNGRWVKVGPFVVPSEGGSRADLLEMFASLSREAVTR